MNGAMSAIPSGQPNMSLIDNSKFWQNRSRQNQARQLEAPLVVVLVLLVSLSGFAKVAEIFSNALSFGTTSSSGGSSDGSNNAVNGDAAANAKQIFDFLKSKGLNDIQAAAIHW